MKETQCDWSARFARLQNAFVTTDLFKAEDQFLHFT